jgi:nicotinamidase-related amidase/type 1 glutamine amidotransferase
MRRIFNLLIICLLIIPTISINAKKQEKVRVSLLQRTDSPYEGEEGLKIITNKIENWLPSQTAIIVCDMWDRHWCKDATDRVAEFAPALNEVLNTARERGVTIVYAPSDCIDYYRNYAGRLEAKKYLDKKIKAIADAYNFKGKLPTEEGAVWPVDQSDEGCENEGLRPRRVWNKQIASLTITSGDLISDSGGEIGSYFKKKGIKNVILTGVHTNMCIIGRSFGLRAMKQMGMNVVLMRDMTDLMYNHAMPPYVDHFTGLDLMLEYIETYVCPTMVSTDFTGKKQFVFAGDKRPRVAFLTAESEYRANQRLPQFAHDLTMKNIHCDFALGIPVMEGAGRHNLENLQILDDANLAVVFIRRRALEPEKMQKIKDYVASGRPIIGLRTASHAFDAKGNVPRSGGSIEKSKEKVGDFLAQWTEFDKEVWGGNYQGHYGHLKTGTDISITPGMENHPVLKGVTPFNSPNWLYQNRPLRSDSAQVLLLGANPDVPMEPVAWFNGDNIFYTSLGHWDDWKIESFRNLMFNVIDRFLNKK